MHWKAAILIEIHVFAMCFLTMTVLWHKIFTVTLDYIGIQNTSTLLFDFNQFKLHVTEAHCIAVRERSR